MLENISFIASVISALSALTTSLRAIGVSGEIRRSERAEKINTGCRIDSRQTEQTPKQRTSLRLHMAVTIIWYMLSFFFLIPFLMHKQTTAGNSGMIIWVSPYLLLLILILLIWKKVLRKD